jgi:succinyl-CoA synthetase beta subunit
MNLHEYQTKAVFARYNIPIPRGRIALTAQEARTIANELGGRVVVKAQVLTGGRGKAGGIRLAKSNREVEDIATQILSMEIKGLNVRKVLVDEAVNIEREIYLGIIIDRSANHPVLMASSEGGVEIEKVAHDTPEKIIRTAIDPLIGLRDYQVRDIAIGIDLPHALWKGFISICQSLWHVFWDNDATLCEINPLVITDDQKLIALDGKMIIDDNSLFRHPDLSNQRDAEGENHGEIEARKYGLTYIKLDGNIGCMVNGAGLAMATMDIIHHFGGEPANFLDIGGGANAEKVSQAIRVILMDPNVKAILINIFGGITRCDEVARGIISALSEIKTDLPMIVRLIGTNADEGVRLLANAHMITASTLEEAALKAIQSVKGEPSA